MQVAHYTVHTTDGTLHTTDSTLHTTDGTLHTTDYMHITDCTLHSTTSVKVAMALMLLTAKIDPKIVCFWPHTKISMSKVLSFTLFSNAETQVTDIPHLIWFFNPMIGSKDRAMKRCKSQLG